MPSCAPHAPALKLRAVRHGCAQSSILATSCTHKHLYSHCFQCGMAVAYGLMRERVTNVLVLDENEVGEPRVLGFKVGYSLNPKP